MEVTCEDVRKGSILATLEIREAKVLTAIGRVAVE